MIPGQTYIATALVAGVVAFGGAWKVQGWRYDTKIAAIKLQHGNALVAATQKAMFDTVKLQRTKDEAIQAAEKRSTLLQADADAARATADSLRKQLASVPARIASATDSAVREYANAASVVFAECTEAYQELAGQADKHTADVRLMQDAWPR